MSNMQTAEFLSRVRFDDRGLVPVIVQERSSGAVLMLAWADAAALTRTVTTREGTYFSRSRNAQWIKGATSGAAQHVHEIRLDCDGDTVLYVVDQTQGACHTGDHTCFDADLVLAADDE